MPKSFELSSPSHCNFLFSYKTHRSGTNKTAPYRLGHRIFYILYPQYSQKHLLSPISLCFHSGSSYFILIITVKMPMGTSNRKLSAKWFTHKDLLPHLQKIFYSLTVPGSCDSASHHRQVSYNFFNVYLQPVTRKYVCRSSSPSPERIASIRKTRPSSWPISSPWPDILLHLIGQSCIILLCLKQSLKEIELHQSV